MEGYHIVIVSRKIVISLSAFSIGFLLTMALEGPYMIAAIIGICSAFTGSLMDWGVSKLLLTFKEKKVSEAIDKVTFFIENIWLSRDQKKITFRIGIDNFSNLKFEPHKGNLSLFKGESATDEMLIDEKDLNRERRGQTIEDAPPKGTGFVVLTLQMKVGDLYYHTYRVNIYVDFETRYGNRIKKEDFTIKCGNRFIESRIKNKEPISIERFSDGDVKWLNS